MKKILIMLFVVMSCSQAFAVTGNVSVEGRMDVTGDSSVSGKLGIGTMESGARLTVAGNIDLTSAGNTISTASTELVLEQTGDALGTTRLRMRNRGGANGAIFDCPSLDLVDFGFLPSSGVQNNFRLEHRADMSLAINSDGEFQFLGPSPLWPIWFRSGRGATVVAEGNVVIGTTEVGTNKLKVQGTAEVTGDVTAKIFYGTFEGTYKGEEIHGASFLYPYMTSEASMRLPYNATITSVEVMIEGAASATVKGRVMTGDNATEVGNATATGTGLNTHVWAVGSVLSANYAKDTELEFETQNVTGIVYNATVQIKYKRMP